MRRLWLLFAQAVTVCIAILFVVTTLRPDWLRLSARSDPRPGIPVGALGSAGKGIRETETRLVVWMLTTAGAAAATATA